MQTRTPLELPADAVMPSLPQDVATAVIGTVILGMVLHGFLLRVREKDDRLLLFLGAAAAGSLLEGFACHLINCWHSAVGAYEFYEMFGIHVPLWLAELYVVFFGGMTCYFLRAFERRARTPMLFWTFYGVVGAIEGGGEMAGIRLGMFSYWGAQPLPVLGFPLYLGFINPALALALTAIGAAWCTHFRGAKRLALVPLAPVVLAGLYAAVTFPTSGFLLAGMHSFAVIGSVASMGLSVLLAAASYRLLASLERPATQPEFINNVVPMRRVMS